MIFKEKYVIINPSSELNRSYAMKANKKFFTVTFLLNMILGLIGGGIFWAVWAIGSSSGLKWVISLAVCAVLFGAFASYLNFSIVKRAKLKTAYFIYGTVINLLFYFLVSAVLPFCFGFTLVL